MNHMDKDKSGAIQYKEFVQMFQEAHVEHERMYKLLHEHKHDSSTASHIVSSHRREEKNQHDKHMKRIMEADGNAAAASGSQRDGRRKKAGRRARGKKGPRGRRAPSPNYRDESQARLPAHLRPKIDPDLLFDETDPFFRSALDTLHTVPRVSPKADSPKFAGEQGNTGADSSSVITAKPPWVAFVIGGPGSSARRICEEMARSHGFTHLNAE